MDALEFGERKSNTILDYFVKAFVTDYMSRRYAKDDSGWRSLGDVAKGIQIRRSTLYSKRKNELSPPLKELVQRGFIDLRYFHGERGRGGEVMKFRVVYENEIIRNFVDQKARSGGAPVNSDLVEKRIAILPFLNISRDTADEYLADGMTEEMIAAISLVEGLSVISRTSVMRYKYDRKASTIDIGRELKVGKLLEGSVRRFGKHLRISVQLVDVATDNHLWSKIYDRTLDDIFAIQSDIARAVADYLDSRLLPEKRRIIENSNTRNVDAHLLYLKARESFFDLTREGMENAIRLYEIAIEKDPHYSLAYAGVSEACFWLGALELLPLRDMSPKCMDYGQRALSIDHSTPIAHFALGCGLWLTWKFDKAEKEFRRAIELDSNSVDAYLHLSRLLIHTGRYDEALSVSESALSRDPLSSIAWNETGSAYLYSRRDYAKAIEYLRKAIQINPRDAKAHINLGLSLVQCGNLEDGIKEITRSLGMNFPAIDSMGESELAYAYAKAGNYEKSKEILDLLLKGVEKNPSWAAAVAAVYSVLGNQAKAFDWLSKAIRLHSGPLLFINQEFTFDNIREDSRFDHLVGKIGLQKPVTVSQN